MRLILSVVLGILLFPLPGLHAQSVGVELDDVIDNRVNAGALRGTLEVRVKLSGSSADKASAARVLVKEAKDNKGTVLTGSSLGPPDFMAREYNNGTLNFSLSSPPRTATSVKVKGTVELFVPDRDPASVVKIEKALAKLDTPFSAKALKAAKIEITPLSVAGYKKVRETQKLDEKKLAEMREEGKRRGLPANEIEMMIELAKTLDAADEEPSAGTVLLSGKREAFDRIFKIDILGEDGEPLHINSRSSSSRGDDTLMTLQPASEVPANATFVVHLLTPKSKITSPFELTVELP